MLSLREKVGFRTAALTSALIGVLVVILSQSHVVIRRIAKLTGSPAPVPSGRTLDATEILLAAGRVVSGEALVLGTRPVLRYAANVHMNVDHPHASSIDDSFFVRVSGLTFSEPDQWKYDALARMPSTKDLTSSSWTDDNIRLLFDSGCLGLSLLIPGSEVSPSGLVRLNRGVAEWIVRPGHSGNYKALIQIRETHCDQRSLAAVGMQPGDERDFGFYIDNASFSVEIIDPLLTREKVLSWIGGFFGAFLTLPGIIAFIESQREKRRKRREEEDKSRRIIL